MSNNPTTQNPAATDRASSNDAAPAPLELHLKERLRRLNEIGVALSVEHDLYALLERILAEARAFTQADAGTLYLVKGEVLTFEIAHNDTMGSRDSRWYGGTDIPPVPPGTLYPLSSRNPQGDFLPVYLLQAI